MTASLPDYRDALTMALQAFVESVDSRLSIERVELAQSAGRVLAQAVQADRDLPPFNRAMMDGYAVRARDVTSGRRLKVIGEVPAGKAASIDVPVGTCVKIATGAPLPADCDSVIPHEQSDRGNPVSFQVESIEPGHAVHARGSDAHQGASLISAGTILTTHHLGIAASVGCTHLHVRARPRVTILTSGDEVVSPVLTTESILPHQIRNSNAIMISELASRFGGIVAACRHVPDEPEATRQAVATSIDESDLLITVGGVSAGERDYFPAAFDAASVRRSLVGAAIQPGRPIVVGRAINGAMVVALPGNPVSALACACLFVWPLVRAMLGVNAPLPWVEVTLAQEVRPNAHRRAFRPAIIDERGHASVPKWAGSGDLAHTSPTHGLIELPVQSQAVQAGQRLRFLPWP